MTEMSGNSQADRLIAVESALAHTQHDFEQLHGVTLELQRELRQLTMRLLRLEQRLEVLGEDPEARSPENERPPHY